MCVFNTFSVLQSAIYFVNKNNKFNKNCCGQSDWPYEIEPTREDEPIKSVEADYNVDL